MFDVVAKKDIGDQFQEYDAFVLSFGGVTIPCLRNAISLGNTVRTDTTKMLLQLLNGQAVTGVRGSVDWRHGKTGERR
jgi:hypothetical protein